MAGDGIAASMPDFDTLISQLATSMSDASDAAGSAGDNANAGVPPLGAITEGDQLTRALHSAMDGLHLAVNTFSQAVDDLHAGTKTVRDNYQHASDQSQLVANALSAFEGYLDEHTGDGAKWHVNN